MIEFLNVNEGVIAIIGVIVSIVIAIIGFCINKNITKISQKQKSGDNSTNNQASGNINIKK